MSYQSIIYNEAKRQGMPVQLAGLIVAQSQHETGNYTHRFFTSGNNAFGYSFNPSSKYQINAGGLADNKQPIAQYKTINDSVKELTDWIKRRQKEGKFPNDLEEIQTPSKYAELLRGAGYYTDTITNYTNGLNYYFNRLPDNLGTNYMALVVLTIIFLTLIWKLNG